LNLHTKFESTDI